MARAGEKSDGRSETRGEKEQQVMGLWKAANGCEREAAHDGARSGSHQQKPKTRRPDEENIPGKDRHELSVWLGTERHDAENGKERRIDPRTPRQIDTLHT